MLYFTVMHTSIKRFLFEYLIFSHFMGLLWFFFYNWDAQNTEVPVLEVPETNVFSPPNHGGGSMFTQKFSIAETFPLNFYKSAQV